MNGREFISRVRDTGKRRGVAVEFVPYLGKGSHGTLYFGERHTVVKDRKKEIGQGLLSKMLRDLGLSRKDLNA